MLKTVFERRRNIFKEKPQQEKNEQKQETEYSSGFPQRCNFPKIYEIFQAFKYRAETRTETTSLQESIFERWRRGWES